MQHMEPETCRQHTGKGTLGWRKVRSLKHAKHFSLPPPSFPASIQLLYLVVYLLIFVLSLFPPQSTLCPLVSIQYVCVYIFIYSELCRSLLRLCCLLLNFPPHSHSSSVRECTHISIRPLRRLVQFPGRLF